MAPRAYATTTPSSDAPPVSDSARQLADHITQHPEKAEYMVKMIGKQVTSIQGEIQKRGPGFEAVEAITMLDALGQTLDAIKGGLKDQKQKDQVEEMIDTVIESRLEAQKYV